MNRNDKNRFNIVNQNIDQNRNIYHQNLISKSINFFIDKIPNSKCIIHNII